MLPQLKRRLFKFNFKFQENTEGVSLILDLFDLIAKYKIGLGCYITFPTSFIFFSLVNVCLLAEVSNFLSSSKAADPIIYIYIYIYICVCVCVCVYFFRHIW